MQPTAGVPGLTEDTKPDSEMAERPPDRQRRIQDVGNSLAIPNAYQVLAGIAEQIRNPQEDEPERKPEPQGQLTIWDFMEQ